MKFIAKTFVLAAIAAQFAATKANAVLIDFDTGTNGGLVGSAYSGLGVTFSNAQWTANFGFPGSSGTLGVRAPGTYTWTESNALIARFAPDVFSVSITGLDVGTSGLRIKAYDSLIGGSLLATDTQFGTLVGVGQFYTVSVSALAIKRVEIFQVLGGGDGIILDNLQFQTAPPPSGVPDGGSGIALLGMAMTAVAGFRRKFGV